MKNNLRNRGFSLVEVVVAVGIFSLAIVGVIGLLGPTSKSVAEVSDSDAATRVIAAIQSSLQQEGIDTVKGQLGGGYVYYATRSGDKIGRSTDTTDSAPSPLAQRFFEFSLTRNTDLSPAGNDSSAGYLAFTLSLRWPAYMPNGTKAADAAKSSMIVPMAITR